MQIRDILNINTKLGRPKVAGFLKANYVPIDGASTNEYT